VGIEKGSVSMADFTTPEYLAECAREEAFGIWLIRITVLPDGRPATGPCEMPKMQWYGTREEIIKRIKQKFKGYTLEIAREYQDSLGRIIKKRRGKWESV